MEKAKTMVVIKPDTYRLLLDANDFLTKSPIANYVQELQKLVPAILNSDKYSSVEKMARYQRLIKKLNDLAEAPYENEIRVLNILTKTEATAGDERQVQKLPVKRMTEADEVVEKKRKVTEVQTDILQPYVKTVQQTAQTEVPKTVTHSMQTFHPTVVESETQTFVPQADVETETESQMSKQIEKPSESPMIKQIGKSSETELHMTKQIEKPSTSSIFRPPKLTVKTKSVAENWVPSPRLEGKRVIKPPQRLIDEMD